MFNNRSFLYGDTVSVYFFVRNGKLILAEECYFFLMASMRKMRLHIPMSFTLEFFSEMFQQVILERSLHDAHIHFVVFRNQTEGPLAKADIQYHFDIRKSGDVLEINQNIEIDLLKEINVNANLLSNILVHCPENIYAEVYADENDLDDVTLLNPNKRIARAIFGNYLSLEGNALKIPKHTEGAYISPLLESFVTYVHKQQWAEVQEVEMSAFESQKADEILMISDQKGLKSVVKIRNKSFGNDRFQEILKAWRESLNH